MEKFNQNFKRKLIIYGLALCGIFAMGLGAFLLVFFEQIVRFFMAKEMELKPSTEFFEIFKEIPIPIFEKIFLFNITNPFEFENGAAPILKEVGPYVYRGRWFKEHFVYNDEEGTVHYQDFKEYTFVEELSVGDSHEKIYTLNGPLLAVINYVEDFAPFFFRGFISELMNGIFESYNESLIVHRSVRELIYDGYHEPMVSDLSRVVEPFMNLPLKLVNDTYGILHAKKHIGDGNFTIVSGSKGLDHQYASIKKWNGMSTVDWWDTEGNCNKIEGTDGVQFHPGVEINETLKLFNPNLCRVIPLDFMRHITVHGIKTYRFGMSPDIFSLSDVNPANKCFCQEGRDCIAGLLPMNCKPGAPFVISKPHFLDADERLKEVQGVNPSTLKHATYVDVEPQTGIVLNARFRIQLNAITKRNSEFTPLQNLAEDTQIIPVLWMSEEATLDTFFANYFKSRVQNPIILFKVISTTTVIIGGFALIASILFQMCVKAKVKPETFKQSLVLKTLNSVYTSVALWPPPEEDVKTGTVSEKTHL